MGQNASILDQWFPPTATFSADFIPDLDGRVAIVTGGNSGIGKETVRQLLAHGAKVYVAARSRSKALAAIDELKKDTGCEALFLELDLADKSSVRRAAKEFLSKEDELHVLFNNGGVMWPDHDQLTKDGLDLQFGTNVVGHYLFTTLLMPALLVAAKASPQGAARVVVTSSSAAYLEGIHWGSFRPGAVRDKMSTYQLYNQSKHANVVFARELGRRFGDKGLVVTAVNPGNLRSDLQRNMNPISRLLLRLTLYPTAHGALTQLWAGTSIEGLDLNGKFLIPWARVGEAPPAASDPEIGRKLWEFLEEETKA
ncbi:NAD-P-binding protein [Auriscalpium vulgare]|uniref:NAD-P-binding protein n=1 Tax=Auriscalpium vulgare TaxID=40419 RepID=A0ACB8S8D5_9AGAM|nr:NAD-P-binding protein [Auriscalpium vulgare]